MSELEKDLLELLVKHNVVDESSLRNHLIRTQYKLLREKENMSGKEARKVIANRFNTSEKNVEYILYMQKK